MGLFGGSNRRYRRYREAALKNLRYAATQADKHYQQELPIALGERQATMDYFAGGYDKAMARTKDSFRGAEQQAFDAEERGYGDIIASLQRRGQNSGTLLGALRRGLTSDTQRTLMEISGLRNQQLAGLEVGKGTGLASIMGKMVETTLMQQRNARLQRVQDQKIAFLSGLMSGGPPSATQEMAQFGFDLAGTVVAGVDAFMPG